MVVGGNGKQGLTWQHAAAWCTVPNAEAMTAPRAREQRRPPSPPDRLPPRRGGRPSSQTVSAAGRPAGLPRLAGARRGLVRSARVLGRCSVALPPRRTRPAGAGAGPDDRHLRPHAAGARKHRRRPLGGGRLRGGDRRRPGGDHGSVGSGIREHRLAETGRLRGADELDRTWTCREQALTCSSCHRVATARFASAWLLPLLPQGRSRGSPTPANWWSSAR